MHILQEAVRITGQIDGAKSIADTMQKLIDAETTVDGVAAAGELAAEMAITAAVTLAVRTSFPLLRLGLAISGQIWKWEALSAATGLVGGGIAGAMIDSINDMHLGSQLHDLLHPNQIDPVGSKANQAAGIISPIVLDLDGDGIETTDRNTTEVYFDLNSDGFAEETGWVSGGDALLVRDLNGNGRIDSGSELFGSATVLSNGTRASNGFVALSELDSNNDGKLDSSDTGFASLLVWKDADKDGFTDEGELLKPTDIGVRSITVTYRESSRVDANGNQHRQVSTYTTTSGETRSTSDVWFSTNPTYTIATEWLEVPDNIQALPDATGYGVVFDLHQAMVRDGQLTELVAQFTHTSNVVEREELTRQIIFRWTGVENVASDSRGPYIDDARMLEALEKFLGYEWYGFANNHDPRANAMEVLQVAWMKLFTLVYGQLTVQSHLKSLFDQIAFSWDQSTQKLVGNLGDVAATITAHINADREAGLVELTEFIRSIDGMSAQSTLDLTSFAAALAPLGQDVVEIVGCVSAIWGTEASDTISGDASNDVIVGGGGDDSLNGGDGNDRLLGGAGQDRLDGGGGDDILVGGKGNDTLVSSGGNDVFRFARGDGQDTLSTGYQSEVGRSNVLELGNGISAGAVELSRSGDSLVVVVSGTEDKVTVPDFFYNDDPTNGYNPLQQIRFSDGTAWSLQDIVNRVLACTDGDDIRTGTAWADTISGQAGNDTLDGHGGDDVLEGSQGNDTLDGRDGNDTLDGGAGNDSLTGGTGNNVYRFGVGDGQDNIKTSNDTTANRLNVLEFKADIVPSGVDVSRSGNSLVLTLAGTNDTVTVEDFFLNDDPENDHNPLQQIKFADGTVWTLHDIVDRMLVCTDSMDNRTGTVWADTINGGAGMDGLDGRAGNDVIDGGDDIDHLIGGDGSDRLNGGAGIDIVEGGDGNDRIDGGTDIDVLIGGAGDDTYFVDSVADLVLENTDGGFDIVYSSANCLLGVNVENLTLVGTSNLNAVGNNLDNVIIGNDGANILDGMGGDDTYYVGAGDTVSEPDDGGIVDTLIAAATPALDAALAEIQRTFGVENLLASIGASVNANVPGGLGITGGIDTVITDVTWTLGANIENLILTGTASIDGTGNSLANRITGNTGDNALDGAGGADWLGGGAGNDSYVIDDAGDVVVEAFDAGIDDVRASVSCTLSANVENLALTGLAAINGTGNELDNRITGNSMNNVLTGDAGNDILDGGLGSDTLIGGSGDDTYYVNIGSDTVVENPCNGTDTVHASVSYTLADNLENLLLDGMLAVTGTGNTGNNYLRGSDSANILDGSAGNDLLEGGNGLDVLNDLSGKGYLNGGADSDSLTGGASNQLFIGGTGQDVVTTGNGADIVAFNRGDGIDILNGGSGTDNTLSLGGGIRYTDLSLSKVINDLVLNVGASEQIVFKNWYAGSANNKSVATLQMVLDASTDYNPNGDALHDNRVEQFDFAGMVAQFDQARAGNLLLSNWALSNALTNFHLGGSDTAALGGDLAYWYGRNDSLTGVSTTAALEVVNASGFGSSNQGLRPFAGISGAATSLM